MKKLLLVIAICVPLLAKSQSYKSQQAQLMTYNIALNGVIGGVSELIINPKHIKHWKAFTHGFVSGCVGGSIIGGSKMLVGYLITNSRYEFVWASNIAHSIGTSVVYNTGRGTRNIQYLNFDLFGLGRLEIDVVNRTRYLKASPFGIGGFVLSCVKKGNKIDLKNTLFLITPCFTTSVNTGSYGVTIVSSITMFNNRNTNIQKRVKLVDSARSHEYIHMMQYREYTNLNNITFGWNKSYLNNSSTFKYINFDLPYLGIAYSSNDFILGDHFYYKNFFEFEAESFATQKYVLRNR